MLLKELIEQVRGVSYKPSDVVSRNEGIPILRASNIQNGKLNFGDLVYLKNNVVKNSQYLKPDDILICTSSGSKELVGKAGSFIEYSSPISFGAFCKVVRTKDRDDVNVEFIKLFFQSPSYKRQITESSLGANINNIKTENIDSLFINLPNTETQSKAVKEMQIIISLIDSKKKELDSLEELVKSRFNEMFVDKGFGVKPIRYFINKDKISAKKIYSESDYINYVDISSIDNSKNEIVSSTKYVFKDAPSRAQQCLKKKDILVSTVRPNLKNIALFDLSNDGYVGSSGFCVLRPVKCNPYYLKFVVLTDEFTDKMISLTTGASYPAIRDNDVFEYQMIDSPIDLQNEFGEFVEMIDKSKFVVQQQIKDLEELLDKKMDEYFGG